MATMTLAWVQTQIAALMAQYQLLSSSPIHEYTVAQRNVHKHKLDELREEIMQLSKMESELSNGASGGMNALVQFGDQV